MVDLKFVFSNIRRTEAKKTLLNRIKRSDGERRHEEITELKEEAKKREIPLFYQHKIRVPKYEYF